MRGSVALGISLAVIALGAPLRGHAAAIMLPMPFVVQGHAFTFETPGTSFVFQGTLTGDDTLQLTATGSVSSGFRFFTYRNAAGVSVSENNGAVPPPGTLTFGHVSSPGADGFYVGALLLSISGIGEEQLIQPSAATGLGGSEPVESVMLPSTSLSALGFGSFSVVDPTLTFVADIVPANLGLGSFMITQDPAAAAAVTPEPGSGWMLGAGLVGVMAGVGRRRSDAGAVTRLCDVTS